MNRSRQFGSHALRPMRCSSRVGFTLVEMLVSVTLVLLMMVMFGEIFQVATGSVTKQRIMADNDQNVRTFITVLRADLDKRTFRTLIPYFPGELSSNPGTRFDNRRGYFYISNNNLADGTDDVLQFTVDSTMNFGNSDDSRYYGRAAPLSGSLLTDPNQPDRDDNEISSNNAGASKAAEVSYWLRGGKLYRRVMLIREPVKGAGVSTNVAQASQPANAAGVDYFAGSYGGNFWYDFDYSAHRKPESMGGLLNARFNGLDYLSNDDPVLPNTPHPFAYSLGQTWNRFGHNSEIAGPAPLFNFPAAPYSPLQNGLPREFSAATTPNFFIGRFTQEETSNAAFQYPQTMPASGNPMDAAATPLFDPNNDSVVDTLALGPRTGVDLLMANVHEFRVEVWDQRIGQFAPIGHSIGAGDYNLGRQLNPTYMPLGGAARIFDTWHPNFDRNFNVPSGTPLGDTADRPPFRALNWDPTAPTTDPSFPPGPTPPGPVPNTNTPYLRGYWAPDTTYSVGDVVFPRTEDLNGNGVFDAGEDGQNGFAPPNGIPNEPRMTTLIPNGNPSPANTRFRPFGLTYAYRCIKAGHTLGSTPAQALFFEPNWSSRPGFVIRGINEDTNNNGSLNPGEDRDGDNVLDIEPDWIVDYNVRPVRAIRITVRFEHPQSKQMKQITIVHSLRDTTSVP